MNNDGFTYLIWDKFAGQDHNFNNKQSMYITIKDLFTDILNQYKIYLNADAINKFNDFGGIYVDAIPKDLDMELFKIYLFEWEEKIQELDETTKEYKSISVKIIITIVSVNNSIIESYKNLKDISNLDFLTTACRYHNMYEKVRKLNGVYQKASHASDFTIETELEIISAIKKNLGDISDPIIENPKFLNCNLYNYQKRSIKWMYDKETNLNNNNEITYNLNDEIVFGNYYYDIVKQTFNKNDNRKLLKFEGGALIDEVGLGKTIQMTTLSILNPSSNTCYYQKTNKLFSNATLVICPNQLCGQWKREIEKMVSKDIKLSIVSILTKTHYKKYTYQEILDADFVIISSTFLENKCFVSDITKNISINKNYLKSSEFNLTLLKSNIDKIAQDLYNDPLSIFNTCVNVLAIYWHRIIIDEFHEIYTVDKYKHVGKILPIFESKYKWAVSGTPFDKDLICLYKMLDFVSGFKQPYGRNIFNIEGVAEYMKNNFFRKNTKQSITAEYKLQPIKEIVLWLKFDPTERMMYNAYLANPNNGKFDIFLRKICCHPKLADEIKDLVSNCKTLDDIQKTMVSHYLISMEEAKKKLNISKIKYEIYSIMLIITEIKRQKRLLKQLNYKVIVEYHPKIDKKMFEVLKNSETSNNTDNVDNDDSELFKNIKLDDLNKLDLDSDSDSDSDHATNNKTKKKIITIKKDNYQEIITKIGAPWNNNRITLDTMIYNLEKIKTKTSILQKEFDGKKTTYEFYYNLLERIKKTANKETKIKDSDSDSNSDSDSDSDSEETCGICLGDIPETDIGVTKCGHMFCYECIKTIIPKKHQCPYCRKSLKDNEIFMISYEKKKDSESSTMEIKGKKELINKVGTKLANLIYYLKSTDKHTIIFSQWDDLLKKVGVVLDEYGITNVFCKGNAWQRDKAIRTFNNDTSIKVIMLSSSSAASGSNLTKASQVILLDPVYGSYEFRRNTEWQAIGRAYRMGQINQVEVVRFVIKNTIEEEIYNNNVLEDTKLDKNNTDIKIFEEMSDIIELSKEKLEELSKAVAIKNKPKVKVAIPPKIYISDSDDGDSEEEDK